MAYISIQEPNKRILDKFETSEGNEIDNYQLLENMATLDSQHRFDSFRKKFPYAEERTRNATSVYNCHGMVFAARRTGIDRNDAVQRILTDDRYVEVLREDVLPGDVVLFISEQGDMEHSAIVIEPPEPDTALMPKVVSKWGEFIEYVHYANHCPYDCSNLRYFRVER